MSFFIPFALSLTNARHYYQTMWHSDDIQCKFLKRIGGRGDGGKYLCMDSLRDPINVLSVGSQGDFSFEIELHSFYPNASIVTMDGTVSSTVALRAPSYVEFVRSNFNANTRVNGRLDILKIDCEGCELHALLPFLKNTCVEQVLIETHACLQSLEKHDALMRKLNHTYGVFSKEPNIEFSDGTCVEFGLLRREQCKRRINDSEMIVPSI